MAEPKVMVIPARRQVGNNINIEEQPKLRVAAYCRVSTDSDEQATSYDAQVEHYTNYINNNSEWDLAGIFADDGISGTNTKKREKFNLMIEECNAGHIDMIITKSISRFARNTLDCLQYIRQLKDKNIPVLFEKESINTMDAKGEVLITIMASLAQQESQSLSQNVKLGLQYRYQQGLVQVNAKRFLGYTKDSNGKLIIEPEQAETVKRIYLEYLDGSSMDAIANRLMADGIINGAGHERWHTSNIRQILINEKYIGDALLQKTYTTDFLTKKRIKNNGTVPQYYVEDNHEAIIPKDIYMLVQEEMVRRRNLSKRPNGKERNFSSKHCLSQIVVCGECNEFYRRIHWNNNGCKSIVWRCMSRLEPGNNSCHSRTVNEVVLQDIIMKAINTMLGDKNKFLETLQQNITTVIRESDVSSTTEIDSRLQELQQELLRRANSKKEYDEVADEIFRLRELKKQSEIDIVTRDDQINRITEMHDFINKQPTEIDEYDETLARRMIQKITVFEDHFNVEFKSSVDVDIKG